MAMSFAKSLAPIGMLLIGYEFLSSIQWTSICDVLDRHYRQNPQLMARGIALLSLSSTLGALAAKTVGAGLLQATNWRTVCRFGSLAALLGAAAMHTGVKDNRKRVAVQISVSVNDETIKQQSPAAILKSILGNKLFWMIGIAHSLGHLAKSSDRLLGPFLQEAASMSSKF
jgi:sugar phosphate permease